MNPQCRPVWAMPTVKARFRLNLLQIEKPGYSPGSTTISDDPCHRAKRTGIIDRLASVSHLPFFRRWLNAPNPAHFHGPI
jgi:hypothetical protein